MTKIKDYSYPKTSDDNLQLKLFKKREFNFHRILKREKFKNYEEIKLYRNEVCKGFFKSREQQNILKNFINPDTPYKGLLIMHGTGTGKTCTAINIAEQFKDQVKKYNTKIFILTFGPNNKETFKSELLFCTGNTYIKNKYLFDQMLPEEREREEKIGVYSALQNYKLLSYKTFYRKVLGEKIVEKTLDKSNKLKSTFKKKDTGEYEREIVADRILNMDNTILIVDEAHNLTGNEYGEALQKIIKSSKNLKVILLTATPMKNLADNIIDILNFLRPPNERIKRDEIFMGEKNYKMKFKPNGEQILREKANGYVSYFRGNIPYAFAKRVDKGEVPNGLLFTHVVKCYMEDFQKAAYLNTVKNFDDTLDRSASAVANFVFPGYNLDNKKLEGFYSTDGYNKFLSQLGTYYKEITSNVNKQIFNNKLKPEIINNFVKEIENKNISGEILDLKYLKFFGIKFYKCIKRLLKLVEGDKGSSTAFIYSNLVKAGGIELFALCLKKNGFLEYQENGNYDLKENTVDYKTGKPYSYYIKNKIINQFSPATYILITGGVDDSGEDIPEIKQKIIRNVFNNVNNKNGKFLKFVLGSKVMNEGVTLENVREVHILDVHYNLGKVDQVIGRAIRMCKHQNVITDDYRFPKVNVYRYVVALENELSTDELLYQKAELKYLMIKRVERILKEGAIDCPLLIHGNKFPEEIDKYKNCVSPTLENRKKGLQLCPAICDFEKCDFKCNNKTLNEKFYDEKEKTYKILDKNNIDYNTFNENFASNEIYEIKEKIKDLYKIKNVYLYEEILEDLKSIYKSNQIDLFDNNFLNKALMELMPKSENDFNNFRDIIFDKYNRPGYIILRDKYYIYQPFSENTNVPFYYRDNIELNQENLISLNNFTEHNYNIKEDNKAVEKKVVSKKGYSFDNKYYFTRPENFIVGIIDFNKNKLLSDSKDLFKIRDPRKKVDKKRGTGIPTLTGAVCATSKDKEYLEKVLEKLPKNIFSKNIKGSRINMCNEIKNRLLYLEKYSIKNNKKTYVMIPTNHDKYEFPYNLEDRVNMLLSQIKMIINRELDVKINKLDNGTFNGERNKSLVKYEILLNFNKYIKDNENKILDLGFKEKDNKLFLIVE